jgi:hypothetical protein
MTEVVYLRVSEQLKEALAARANEQGSSQNQAASELIELGLAASDHDRARGRLEAKLAATNTELAQTRARLEQAELGLREAGKRERTTSRLQRALAQRAHQQLAACPQCRTPLRGSDYLVTGHCPNCQRPITNLLTPKPQTGAPNKDEYLALLGALGGLLSLALTDPD